MASLDDGERNARQLRRFLAKYAGRDRMRHSFERSSVWISGPTPAPSVMSRPRSIAWRTNALAAATASGKGAPTTTLAAMALDKVQPVPCKFVEATLGAAKRRTASSVTKK